MDRSEVIAECRERHGKREISDQCARDIVRLVGGRNLTALAFVLRGELPADDEGYPRTSSALGGETKLWRMVFATYGRMSADDRLMGDMLGTYLLQHALKRVP
jgi:hypothetical protein